eukprot:gene3671-4226_t
MVGESGSVCSDAGFVPDTGAEIWSRVYNNNANSVVHIGTQDKPSPNLLFSLDTKRQTLNVNTIEPLDGTDKSTVKSVKITDDAKASISGKYLVLPSGHLVLAGVDKLFVSELAADASFAATTIESLAATSPSSKRVTLGSIQSANRFTVHLDDETLLLAVDETTGAIAFVSSVPAAISSSNPTSPSLAYIRAAKLFLNLTVEFVGGAKPMQTTLSVKKNGQPRRLIHVQDIVIAHMADWSISAFHLDQATGLTTHLWTREEALSSIIQSVIVEPPPSPAALSRLAYEFNETAGVESPISSFFTHLSRRLRVQAAAILGHDAPEAIKKVSSRGDMLGVDKIIVVSTVAGKIFGMRSNARGVLSWSLYFEDFDGRKEGLSNIQMHTTSPSSLSIVYKRQDVGSIVSTINIIDGIELDQQIVPHAILHSSILPQSILTGADSKLVLTVLKYPAGQPPMAQVLPWNEQFRSQWESLKKVSFFLVNRTSSEIDAFSIEGLADPRHGSFKTAPMWRVNFGLSQRIVHVASRDQNEVIGSPAIILGNRNLLSKYLNHNLISVACLDTKATILYVYLIDSITGQILKQYLHPNAGGHISMVHLENSVVYSHFDSSVHKQIVTAIDMFERTIQWKKMTFSSYDSNNDVEFRQKSFVFPSPIQTLSVSLSSKGITTKTVLVGMVSGQILPIDKKWIDSRRPYPSEQTPHDAEEGLIPYRSGLNFPQSFYTTYNTTIPLLRSISTQGTPLESTSLMVSFGLDLFVSLISPVGTYDILSDNFDHLALILTSLLLAVMAYITTKIRRKKNLNKKWK